LLYNKINILLIYLLINVNRYNFKLIFTIFNKKYKCRAKKFLTSFYFIMKINTINNINNMGFTSGLTMKLALKEKLTIPQK